MFNRILLRFFIPNYYSCTMKTISFFLFTRLLVISHSSVKNREPLFHGLRSKMSKLYIKSHLIKIIVTTKNESIKYKIILFTLF